MISMAQFAAGQSAAEDNAALSGFEQLKGALGAIGAKTGAEEQEETEQYSGYVLVAIPLKNGSWCPGSGVVTGYISLPSLAIENADAIGRTK